MVISTFLLDQKSGVKKSRLCVLLGWRFLSSFFISTSANPFLIFLKRIPAADPAASFGISHFQFNFEKHETQGLWYAVLVLLF
jgi:hypothetical protein